MGESRAMLRAQLRLELINKSATSLLLWLIWLIFPRGTGARVGSTKKGNWLFAEITFCHTNVVKAQVVICKRLTKMMEFESKTRGGPMEKGKVKQ